MTKPNNKVTYSVNEHGIEMLTIKGEKRDTWISLKKAVAILATNDNADAISEVQKHGRTLYKIDYGTGKCFTVGQAKIDTVLDNESGILLALHSSIDSAKEA